MRLLSPACVCHASTAVHCIIIPVCTVFRALKLEIGQDAQNAVLTIFHKHALKAPSTHKSTAHALEH